MSPPNNSNKVVIMANLYKILAVIALLPAAFLALEVSSDALIKKVSQGSTAEFLLTVKNPGLTNANLSVATTLPTSFTGQNLNFSGSVDTRLFVFTNWAKPDIYLITVTATAGSSKYEKDLVLVVGEGVPVLRIDSQYASLSVAPGSSQELRFTVANAGNDILRNVVISSDIPQGLSPEYPAPFDLAPGSKDVAVRITVPESHAEGYYTYNVKAGSGNVEESDSVRIYVQGKPSFVGAVEMGLESTPLVESGEIKGYLLNVRLRNKGSLDVQGLSLHAAVPADWTVSGDRLADLRAFETKDVQLSVVPKDFEARNITVSLTRDAAEVASQSITLAGYRVAAGGTGAFFLGSGSLTIGLLILAVALLVLFYVRQRNKYEDRLDELKTKSYLTQLVDEAKKDFDRDKELKKEL